MEKLCQALGRGRTGGRPEIPRMKEIGMGTGEYELVRVLDKKPGQRPLEDGTDKA